MLNRLIKTANLQKLPIFPVYGHNKISKTPRILAQFWSNVTYSPDNPVNVFIETRGIHQNGTVPSNRFYKMHEITFIHVTSTHCRIQMASCYLFIAFQILSLICTFQDITQDKKIESACNHLHITTSGFVDCDGFRYCQSVMFHGDQLSYHAFLSMVHVRWSEIPQGG